MTQYEKAILVMDYLQGLGLDMITIGSAVDDKVLEQSCRLIKENPHITKEEFLTTMGIVED